MAQRTPRVQNQVPSEEEHWQEAKRIQEEKSKIGWQRLKEEDETFEKRKQRFEEEEKKMREEQEQNIRPSDLTKEQKRIRSVIMRRIVDQRAREKRAATDEKYRQKLEARLERGGDTIQRISKDQMSKLTEEEKRLRYSLRRKSNRRAAKLRILERTAEAENSEHTQRQEDERYRSRSTEDEVNEREIIRAFAEKFEMPLRG